jgi:hypothetical protein
LPTTYTKREVSFDTIDEFLNQWFRNKNTLIYYPFTKHTNGEL